jgi:hypothetical protein
MKYFPILILFYLLPGCSDRMEPYGGKRAAVFFWSTDTDPLHYPIEILYDGKVLGMISAKAPNTINCAMAYDSGYIKAVTPNWLLRTYLPYGDYSFTANLSGSTSNISWSQTSIDIDYGQCFYITP